MCSLPCRCASLLEWAVPPEGESSEVCVCAHPPEETGCQAGKRRGTSRCPLYLCLHTWGWEQKEYHLFSTSMWPVSAPLRSKLCRWCGAMEMTGRTKIGHLCKSSRILKQQAGGVNLNYAFFFFYSFKDQFHAFLYSLTTFNYHTCCTTSIKQRVTHKGQQTHICLSLPLWVYAYL